MYLLVRVFTSFGARRGDASDDHANRSQHRRPAFTLARLRALPAASLVRVVVRVKLPRAILLARGVVRAVPREGVFFFDFTRVRHFARTQKIRKVAFFQTMPVRHFARMA